MNKVLIVSFLILGCTAQFEPIEINNPASENGKYPRLFTDNTNTVFMTWYEETNDTTFLYYSKYR